MNRKNIGLILALAVALFAYLNEQGLIPTGSITPDPTQTIGQVSEGNGTAAIAEAYRAQRSDVQVRSQGTVKKVLRDDLDGSRHQRFLLGLDNGQTLLIAHNIDLAPRVDDLHEGDSVEFYGEYEWNNKGGVVHWTHRDPGGRHADGWLKHQGRTYQ
ncbi:MAG: DUF3465 domain-containing protein [Sedimenticolaceae bacterium]